MLQRFLRIEMLARVLLLDIVSFSDLWRHCQVSMLQQREDDPHSSLLVDSGIPPWLAFHSSSEAACDDDPEVTAEAE